MIQLLQKFKPILPAAALALLVVIGSPSVATAVQNPERAETGQVRAQVAVTEESMSTTQTSETNETSETTEADTSKRAETRTKAEAKVKALREERKVTTTAEKREKICESRKKGLETKITSLSTNALRYQARIDTVFEKLPATTVAKEYALAEAAKTQADESVKALAFAKQSTLIDCNNINVATEVVAFKTVAATARTDLKAYKMAVKAVLKSLKTVTPKTTDSTEASSEVELTPKPEVTEGTN